MANNPEIQGRFKIGDIIVLNTDGNPYTEFLRRKLGGVTGPFEVLGTKNINPDLQLVYPAATVKGKKKVFSWEWRRWILLESTQGVREGCDYTGPAPFNSSHFRPF